MAKSIFICGTSQEAGSSIITLGLTAALKKTVGRTVFLKPVGGGRGRWAGGDSDVELIHSLFEPSHELREVCPVSVGEARSLVARGEHQELLHRIREAYDRVAEAQDLVILEGINQQRAQHVFDMDISTEIAAHLETPVLMVARGDTDGGEANPAALAEAVTLTRNSFEEKGCDVLGVVVNRVDGDNFEQTRAEIRRALEDEGHTVFGVVPELKILGRAYMDQIA